MGSTIERQVSALQAFSLNKALKDGVEAINAQHDREPQQMQANLQKLDREWIAADKGDIFVFSRLNNPSAASELKEYSKTFPDNVEVFVTDKYGGLVAATNRTSDYYQADEGWWQAAWNNGKGATYIGQPEYDQSSKSFAINIAIPSRTIRISSSASSAPPTGWIT